MITVKVQKPEYSKFPAVKMTAVALRQIGRKCNLANNVYCIHGYRQHPFPVYSRHFSRQVGSRMRIYLEQKKWVTDDSTLEFIEQYGKWMLYGLIFAGTIELVGFSVLSVTIIKKKYNEFNESE